MARKVKTITEETLENQAADLEPELTQAEIDLDRFFANIGDNADKIRIYRYEQGEKAFLDTLESSVVTEKYLKETWGGGRYYLVATLNGEYVKGGCKNIRISGPPKEPDSNRVESTLNPQSNGEINALRDALNRQQELLITLLTAQKDKPTGPSVAEIIQLIDGMQSRQAVAPDPSTMFSSISSLFAKAMDLAKDSAGGEDWKVTGLRMVGTALDKLPQLIGPLMAVKMNQKQPGGETMQPAPVNPDDVLREAIAQLKPRALKGTDPGLIVDWIEDNLDDVGYKNMAIVILNRPFEQIIAFDPELQNEPLKSWFQELYTGLHEALSGKEPNKADADKPSNPVAGTPRSDPDAK
jgi:hypothetical protein